MLSNTVHTLNLNYKGENTFKLYSHYFKKIIEFFIFYSLKKKGNLCVFCCGEGDVRKITFEVI